MIFGIIASSKIQVKYPVLSFFGKKTPMFFISMSEENYSSQIHEWDVTKNAKGHRLLQKKLDSAIFYTFSITHD